LAVSGKGKKQIERGGKKLRKRMKPCIEILPVKVIFKYISHKRIA